MKQIYFQPKFLFSVIQASLVVFLVMATGALPLDRAVPNLPKVDFNYEQLPAPDGDLDDLRDLDTTPDDNPITNAGATLGRVLFFDRNLSQNGLVRCATCHSQETGFDDPNRFSIGFEGRITGRNSMGLANARFNGTGSYFWDERAATLEAQVLEPIFDPVEMGLEPAQLIERVTEQPYYKALFVKAFGSQEITQQRISRALSQFVRSMVSFNSRFDRSDGYKGRDQPRSTFTAVENRGAYLFYNGVANGGAGCSACHVSNAHIMTAPANNGLDLKSKKDLGLAEVTGLDSHRGMFRAPSLRNIGVRQPFMHDGRFETLEQVVEHYSKGVQPHPNLDSRLKGVDGSPVRIHLAKDDVAALVAFLNTLTDETFIKDPKFSDPFSNK